MQEVTINKQARLSDHFTLGELCKTSVKTADGNIPSHVHIENLRRLCGWLERSPRGAYLCSLHVYHKQQCVLEHYRTMVGEEYRSFGCGSDIVEYLTVVGVDNMGE